MEYPDIFNFQGTSLYYNRISINNWGERAIEIPLGFYFLAQCKDCSTILEVGNVLSNYENSLSEFLNLRRRRIIDKFEKQSGVENLDLMELPESEKYEAILSISTVEHIGQSVNPFGTYGELSIQRDLEAPLKAIAKIYQLLAFGGKAFITVPFGLLSDGGWYIQFNTNYLNLLTEKYQIPETALEISYLRRIVLNTQSNLLHQIWVEESQPERLAQTEYDYPWPYANAIAVLKLSKISEDFSLLLDCPPTPLNYHPNTYNRQTLYAELVESAFTDVISRLRLINLVCFPNWELPEEELILQLTPLFTAFLAHSEQEKMTLLLHPGDHDPEEVSLLVSAILMDLFMEMAENPEIENTETEPEIFVLGQLKPVQWDAIKYCLTAQIKLDSEELLPQIPQLTTSDFSNQKILNIAPGFAVLH